MRWPWQRAAPTPTPPPAPVHAPAPPPPPSPAGWAFLPPMQRQVSDAAPATLAPGFVSSLPTRAVPRSLGTMGHLVDAAAPGGTVAGHVEGLGAPVQRAVVADLTLRPPTWGASRAASHGSPGASPREEDAAPLPVADAAPSGGLEALRFAERSDAAAAADLAGSDTAESVASALEAAPRPAAPRPAAPVLADRPPVSGDPGSVPVQRADASPAERDALSPASAPGAHSARRLGLGVPVSKSAAPAPGPVVQRADAAAFRPPAVTGPSASRAALDAAGPAPGGAGHAGSGPAGGSLESAGDALPLAGSTGDTGSSSVARDDSTDAPAESADLGSTGAEPATIGLVGSAPRSSTVAPPVTADEPAFGASRSDAAVGSLPLQRHRLTDASDAAGAAAGTASGDVIRPIEARGSGPDESALERTAPLISQRALEPMLAVSPAPVRAATRHPRATAVVAEPPDGAGVSAAAAASASLPASGVPASAQELASPGPGNAAGRGAVARWIQRLAESDATRRDRAPGPSAPAAALDVQRATSRHPDGPAPAPSSHIDAFGAGAEAEAGAVPAPPAIAASSAGRIGVRSGAAIAAPTSPPRAPLPVAAAAPTIEALVAQRDAAASVEPSPPQPPPAPEPDTPTGPALEPEASAAEPAGTAATVATAAATAAAAGAAAGAGATSPAAIETLAGQLYGPLVRRLKAELLLDRERRGLRIDGI